MGGSPGAGINHVFITMNNPAFVLITLCSISIKHMHTHDNKKIQKRSPPQLGGYKNHSI